MNVSEIKKAASLGVLTPNGRTLVDRGIITNLPEDPTIREKCIQQVGVDLTVKHIKRIKGEVVVFPDSFSTKKLLPKLEELPIEKGLAGFYWELGPGSYDVVFHQGCNIPSYLQLLIRQRSTLLRGGITLHSSVFDPGFKTENIGTVFTVGPNSRLIVYKHSRIAQIYAHLVEPVNDSDLYGSKLKGSQYQFDKHRK